MNTEREPHRLPLDNLSIQLRRNSKTCEQSKCSGRGKSTNCSQDFLYVARLVEDGISYNVHVVVIQCRHNDARNHPKVRVILNIPKKLCAGDSRQAKVDNHQSRTYPLHEIVGGFLAIAGC